mgnify:CR=1 FL=1
MTRYLSQLIIFDASINRISAWITGMRSIQKALLYALLEPTSLRKLQDENRFTELMAAQEELKIMPFGDIWQEYLNRENVAADYVSEVMDYEKKSIGGTIMKDILTAPFVKEMCDTTANMYRLGWDEKKMVVISAICL